jgi:hypothetical protein
MAVGQRRVRPAHSVECQPQQTRRLGRGIHVGHHGIGNSTELTQSFPGRTLVFIRQKKNEMDQNSQKTPNCLKQPLFYFSHVAPTPDSLHHWVTGGGLPYIYPLICIWVSFDTSHCPLFPTPFWPPFAQGGYPHGLGQGPDGRHHGGGCSTTRRPDDPGVPTPPSSTRVLK